MGRRFVLPLALLAVVAGCGGTSAHRATPTSTSTSTQTATVPLARTQHPGKQAYVLLMQQLGHRLGTTVDSVYPIDTGTAGSRTSRDTAAKLERARKGVQAVLASLQRIDPPAAVRADHRQIERGVQGMAAEMQLAAVALREGDLNASIEPAALPSLQIVTAAIDRMEHKGYDVLARAASNKS